MNVGGVTRGIARLMKMLKHISPLKKTQYILPHYAHMSGYSYSPFFLTMIQYLLHPFPSRQQTDSYITIAFFLIDQD